MKKGILTGILVLTILTASTGLVFADDSSTPADNADYAIDVIASKGAIEIISPKGNIIVQDSVLISVKVLNNASVILTIYKEPGTNPIFGPQKIEPDNNLNFYTKHLKGLTPGEYKMVFDIQNQEPVIKRFTVKDKEAEIRQSLQQIPKINILGNLLKQFSQ